MVSDAARVTHNGYILSYEARLNPLKLGTGTMAFVEGLPNRTTPNVFDAFTATVQVHSEIMECHVVAYRRFVGTVLCHCRACAKRGHMR